jgi:hypothetical protein
VTTLIKSMAFRMVFQKWWDNTREGLEGEVVDQIKARPEQVESDKGVETTPVRARWPTSPWRRNGAPNSRHFETEHHNNQHEEEVVRKPVKN